jgi:hypothetical protein
MLVSYLGYSSTLKTVAIFSNEALVNFQSTTRLLIPEDRFQGHKYISIALKMKILSRKTIFN